MNYEYRVRNFFHLVYSKNLVPVGLFFGFWLKVSAAPTKEGGLHDEDTAKFIAPYYNVEEFTISTYFQLALMLSTLVSWFAIVTYLYLSIIQRILKFIIFVVGLFAFQEEIVAIGQIALGFYLSGHLISFWILMGKTYYCDSYYKCEKMWPNVMFTPMNYICGGPTPEEESEPFFDISYYFFHESFYLAKKANPFVDSTCHQLFYQFGIDFMAAVLSGCLVMILSLIHKYILMTEYICFYYY